MGRGTPNYPQDGQQTRRGLRWAIRRVLGCNQGRSRLRDRGNVRDRGQEDQDAFDRRVVQLRPGQLDLFQLAEALCAKGVNSAFVAGVVRVRSELAVQEPPREPQRSTEREGPVDQPQVEIEAQRRPFEGLEGGEIEWHRMAHNLVEESLTQSHLAFPLSRLVGPLRIPPEIGEFSDEGRR